ncbi:hypothetical protein BD289DRAFT_432447 [Coniella lustricola]|uniref:Uncharacterized protein n=1 Tax=Coniella lustricola TaxID=2025994 RepID=A0A2T3A9Q0_9PEZI|nr:hypothetical protein BD289DRAFT_432447 [Coniella lustricola]
MWFAVQSRDTRPHPQSYIFLPLLACISDSLKGLTPDHVLHDPVLHWVPWRDRRVDLFMYTGEIEQHKSPGRVTMERNGRKGTEGFADRGSIEITVQRSKREG